MSAATTAATTATTVAAVIAQATKASGVIVKVSPDEFMAIVRQNAEALVVHAVGGVIRENHQYLTSYRGLAFYTKSSSPLSLPPACQVVTAQQIWVPG
jgi:hypothetical protein